LAQRLQRPNLSNRDHKSHKVLVLSCLSLSFSLSLSLCSRDSCDNLSYRVDERYLDRLEDQESQGVLDRLSCCSRERL